MALIFCSSLLFSEDIALPKNKIKAVNYKAVGEATIATMECTDKAVWKCIISQKNEQLLSDLTSSLKKGTEVFIYPMPGRQVYWLKANNKTFEVTFKKDSLPFLTTLSSIDKVIISKAGWFSSEENKYLLTLSDGTTWEVNPGRFEKKYHALEHWTSGNRILITMHESEPCLVNLDAPHCLEENSSICVDTRATAAMESKVVLLEKSH